MIGLLIVSHSARLAEGVQEFVAQISGGQFPVMAAGGASDGSLGTSVERILTALEQLRTTDGILVLVDLGSAVMSVETALEQFTGPPVQISNAPLVEGAYLAAVEASNTVTTLEQVAAAALQARELIKVYE
ncbi:MAG: PTS mannose transporter subunit IID [Chloroflexus sp.]|uniref:dihydroxyacetone kinase phosphoryl donor subunit DhaM n=1 Tax=Chloroflexus sp. TaxID=1904827 RepID=UPI0021DCF3EC|nr:dihydroxyacetone kinase phosphoryl donor subunit DhaM [Chloroflexus sp.]GIV88845.1 MAG: PTS mannose transporter subunit IID [Chloroflexus sp.]